MDSGKILLVNLSKGRVGELNSKLLGMIFVMKFQAAAMSRANIEDKSKRRDFCLYVDEFQNFSTDSFASILSEARKYGLNLIVANQFTTQLTEEVRDAVFGNIGTMVAFRVGTADAEALEKIFRPVFDVNDLQRLPVANMIVRTLVGGMPTQPFSMNGLPILGNSNKQLADALKQLSAAKYGRPKAVVEAEIFKRLSTEKTAPKPIAPGGFASFDNDRPSSFGSSAAGGSSQSSFLDEWLTKRRASTAGKTESTSPASFAAKSLPQDDNSRLPAKNISSNAIDGKEVDSIAAQIKQDLSPAVDAFGKNANTHSGKDTASTQPQITQKDGVLNHNDTVYIDKEGVLHNQNQ
jgi:hypothetical protein